MFDALALNPKALPETRFSYRQTPNLSRLLYLPSILSGLRVADLNRSPTNPNVNSATGKLLKGGGGAAAG